MEITKQQVGNVLELRINGRLDAYWADHLANEIQEVIRGGADRLRLDLSEVTFLSSAGMRVLLVNYQKLQAIDGALTVSRPSETVRQVLELAGFEEMLLEAAPEDAAPAAAAPAEQARELTHGGARFEVFEHTAGGSLQCRVLGDPELLFGCTFRGENCRSVQFPASTFAVGLGAFGANFADCRERFGEFLAVAGSAAYLPTDGTNVPDYMLATGTLIPDVQVLYGLACEGPFAQVARFEATDEPQVLSLSNLAEAALQISGKELAGVAVVAESAGLIGAALRRSPALGGDAGAPFAHPGVREWLSFTAEPAYPRSLALVVGVVARNGAGSTLAPLLRPIGGNGLSGHFHAAAFTYRPLQRGEIELKPTVSTLFEAETLQGVLHLLHDDRQIAGAGESEFVRGACWISPIAGVAAAA